MNTETKRQPSQSMLRQKQQVFAAVLAVWTGLFLWSGSAFLAHIQTLDERYPLAAMGGALTGEIVVLILAYWHVYHEKTRARKWAIVLSTALAVFLVAHSGAVRGLRAAETHQSAAEKRLAENLGTLNQAQAAGAGQAAGNLRASGATKKEAQKLGQGIAANANKTALEEMRKANEAGAQKILESSIFPSWYIKDWMYTAIFIMSLLIFAGMLWVINNSQDVDANYDGIPDSDQGKA